MVVEAVAVEVVVVTLVGALEPPSAAEPSTIWPKLSSMIRVFGKLCGFAEKPLRVLRSAMLYGSVLLASLGSSESSFTPILLMFLPCTDPASFR